MPVDLKVAAAQRFEFLAFGVVTVAEAKASIAEMASRPDMWPGANILVDARDVAGVPSTQDLRQIAECLRPMVALGLRGIGIVSTSPLVFGVSRMFGVFAETVGATVGAFKCPDQARRWLSENRKAPRD